MNTDSPVETRISQEATRWKTVLRNSASILAALLIFLFALDLMISSLHHVGKSAAETIILATSNPFTGLFIGLLITALIQSSSAVTSMIVALVASGAITIEGAIPIVMGANVGTTITSTIVSLGFITKKKEFRRAVAAGTYHSFFNILTVVLLFPLEYYYGFLSRFSEYLASTFFHQPIGPVQGDFALLGNGFGFIVNFLVKHIDNGFILAALSIGLLYGSILYFRKILSKELGFGSQEKFQRFFFRSPIKSLLWGLLTTAAIRSSTVTTSLVVPLVAKRLVKLRAAAPFILGANVGTTITAFIAAMFNSNAAISIAIAHFLFNFIGVLVFFPIPYCREIPIKLAESLGKLTLKYRLTGFAYILVTFFFIPFSLIYINKNGVQVRELVYEKSNLITGKKSFYKIIAKTFENQPVASWSVYDQWRSDEDNPAQIFSVYKRRNILFINNEFYELQKPGFCRDGETKEGKFQLCVRDVQPHMIINAQLTVDSVYVFERNFYKPVVDSTSIWTYISGTENLPVRSETRDKSGRVLTMERLYSIEEK
jgi:solute carrier family 34 (sodium-dependent phosphate cotransporter)